LLVALLAVPGAQLFHDSLQPFVSFDEYSRVFDANAPYRHVIYDTFAIAAMATAVTAAIGLPLAYYIALRSGWKRFLVLAIVVIPFFTGILVKNFVWTVIMQDNGILNDALGWLGIGHVHLLFTRTGVLIGMAHYLLPLFVLPVAASLSKLDRRLVVAARSLGASRFTAFRLITLRLARPGLVTGSLVVFIVSLGFYVTPAMLGGRGNLMVANVVDVAVRRLADFNFAAALAGVLTLVVLVLLPLALRYVRPEADTSDSVFGGPRSQGGGV
jgi:ABC-type spermidine/putrescine transport system permease subunit I